MLPSNACSITPGTARIGDERGARRLAHLDAHERQHERHHDEAAADADVARGQARSQADSHTDEQLLARELAGCVACRLCGWLGQRIVVRRRVGCALERFLVELDRIHRRGNLLGLLRRLLLGLHLERLAQHLRSRPADDEGGGHHDEPRRGNLRKPHANRRCERAAKAGGHAQRHDARLVTDMRRRTRNGRRDNGEQRGCRRHHGAHVERQTEDGHHHRAAADTEQSRQDADTHADDCRKHEQGEHVHLRSPSTLPR